MVCQTLIDQYQVEGKWNVMLWVTSSQQLISMHACKVYHPFKSLSDYALT